MSPIGTVIRLLFAVGRLVAGPRKGPDGDGDGDDDEPLLPDGNPLRLRGALLLGGGALFALVLMTLKAQFRFGVPLGALAIFVATVGALDLLGTFDDPDDTVAHSTTIGALARPLALFAAGAVGVWVNVSLAVLGVFSVLPAPHVCAGAAITASFLLAVVGGFRVGEALGCWDKDEDGAALPMLRRHGFWLVAIVTLLYLPFLGSHSLTDPWETHYGEVSREILARNDWISTWWAQDGWFWSKPVLDFWLQALAMATFGVRYAPNAMLSSVAEGYEPAPEWAVRLPIFLLTLAAIYLLYRAVAIVFGRRAGLLGGLVLATMPQWFLIAHQTVTDMPFVAPMAACMALVLLGSNVEPTRLVKTFEVDVFGLRLRLSAVHVVLGLITACALPQITYLLSRNLEIRPDPFDVRVHVDAFMSGSPGNCGLPGNEICKPWGPVLHGLHPALQALIWAQALALLLYLNWGERRLQRLLFLAAWFFAALSTMAKGPAGFGVPMLAVLAGIGISRRWRDLLRVEIAGGGLILACMALPWFVAMYGRHGQPFIDRLLFHDMFKRAFTHVHDTNEGDDTSFRFYAWQLGYAMFPWIGLAPVALTSWLGRREEGNKSAALALFGAWFVLSFALFSLMLTKFHHYVLPAVPPAAMLIGVTLDRALGPSDARPPKARAIYLGGMLASTFFLALGAARATAARALLQDGAGAFFAATWLDLAIALLGASGLVLAARYRSDDEEAAATEGAAPPSTGLGAAYRRAILGAAGFGGGLLVLLVGRDLSAQHDNLPNQIRFVHLFSYNYKRLWPASLDFTGALWAATILGGLLVFGVAWPRVRRHAVVALTSLAIVFTAWGIDVYFAKIAPHWGQRDTILAYYRAIQTTPGPLVAYQMNWKGENFYTGNHVAAFISSGKKFQDYITEQKKKGAKTFYFLSEHSRTQTLHNELSNPRIFEKLTTLELDNKFVLVKATFE